MKNISESLRKFVAGLLGNLAILILSAIAVSDAFITFSTRAKTITILWGLLLFLFSIWMFPKGENFDRLRTEEKN